MNERKKGEQGVHSAFVAETEKIRRGNCVSTKTSSTSGPEWPSSNPSSLIPSNRLILHIVIFINIACVSRRSLPLPSCAVHRRWNCSLRNSLSHASQISHLYTYTRDHPLIDATFLLLLVHDEDASNPRGPHSASPLSSFFAPLYS